MKLVRMKCLSKNIFSWDMSYFITFGVSRIKIVLNNKIISGLKGLIVIVTQCPLKNLILKNVTLNSIHLESYDCGSREIFESAINSCSRYWD